MIERFVKTGDTQNPLDKPCFQHDMSYGYYKDLAKGTDSDKVLTKKALNIASDPKYDEYQRKLVSMFFKFFDKKSAGSEINLKNQELSNELHKLIIRKFNKRRAYSSFRDNFLGADVAHM